MLIVAGTPEQVVQKLRIIMVETRFSLMKTVLCPLGGP
jgi:hypothetical protein